MWAVTQTDRFKAAISHAGVSNNISFYGNSMYQLLFEFEFGGKPWEKSDEYWARSPMAHITNVSTVSTSLAKNAPSVAPLTLRPFLCYIVCSQCSSRMES